MENEEYVSCAEVLIIKKELARNIVYMATNICEKYWPEIKLGPECSKCPLKKNAHLSRTIFYAGKHNGFQLTENADICSVCKVLRWYVLSESDYLDQAFTVTELEDLEKKLKKFSKK